MNVVGHDFHAYDFQVLIVGDFSQYGRDSFSRLAGKNHAPIFRYPYEVIEYVIPTMAG
jgi:hypothetical protein